MEAVVILSGLLIGLIVFDLAALRWGVDSSDGGTKPNAQGLVRWRGLHGR